YVWLDDMPVAVIDSTGASPATYYIHTGPLEEPLTMTDAAQNDAWDAFVEPFGQAQVFAAAANINLRLPGQYSEDETGGLSQNWNRNYDPSLGRYIEADPLGIDAGQNVYGYVDGDPLSVSDPRGLGPAGAIVGGQVGGWLAGLAGIETGPGELGIIPLGETIGSVVGNALEPILMAQNNKQLRKRIAGLQAHIDEHQRKLDQDPNCRDANGWRKEIAAAKADIARIRRRLPNGK